MRNKYPGVCANCGLEVKVGDGYFQRWNRRWIVRCIKCVTEGKIKKERGLSKEQYKFAMNNDTQKHL